MSADALVTTLKSMKLHGMAGAISDLAEQGSPAFKQSGELLDKLIKAEVAEREVRSINYQMKIARFPAHRNGHRRAGHHSPPSTGSLPVND
jgi:hypothetical protein